MELHDYRVNAQARKADAIRTFLRAEAAGITLLSPDRPRRRWFGGSAPAAGAVHMRVVANADLQTGN